MPSLPRSQAGPGRDDRAAAFARTLTRTLRELGIRHRDLADAVGVSVHTIASWTRVDGAKIPGGDNLRQLAFFVEQRRPGAGRALEALAGDDHPFGASSPARPIATTFVGRDALVEEVFAATQTSPLVTLIGVGGVGKTRLASQVASLAVIGFDDGAMMVELAPLGTPGLVPMALAAALNVRVPAGGDALEAIIRQYEHANALIVLDNCEHLLAACTAAAGAILGQCARMRILATSREPLRVPGEAVIRVPQLELPEAAGTLTRESLLRSDAARLFVTRAMNARGGFKLGPEQISQVANIVRKLDGLPLAIELAAASAGMMDLGEIAARLDDRFRLLVGGGQTLSRHRTLQATMDWSYALLTPSQQAVFASLSVFRGGWTLESATAVVDPRRTLTREPIAALLTGLYEKSLITLETSETGARYAMLETMREYALDRLAQTSWAAEARARHARWCLDLAEASDPALRSSEQLTWLARLDAEHANLRAALDWAIDEAGDPELAARIVAALRVFWQRRAHYREGYDYAERALALPGAAGVPPRARGGALLSAGISAFFQARYREAKTALETAMAAFDAAGDRAGRARALIGLGEIAMYHDEYGLAEAYAAEALTHYSAAGDAWGIAFAHSARGYAVGRMPNTPENTRAMREAFEQAVAGFEACGDHFGLGAALNGLGGAALHVENYAEAEGYYRRSLAIHRALDDEEWASRGLNNLGVSARGQGDTRRALALFEEALQIRQRLGAAFGIATLEHNIGDALTALGEPGAAIPHMRECVRLNLGYNDLHGLAQGLSGMAGIWLAQDRRHADAARLLGFSAPHLGYPGPTAGGSDHVEFEEKLALARARLSETGLAEALAIGAVMPAAEAAALALKV